MALILLIDDDESVRGAIRRVLAAAGHEVIEAAHGGPALERLAGGVGVDLILTDLLMPEVEGMELLAAARRRWPAVPVLVMSGGFAPGTAADLGAGADYLRMARQLGAARTLAKPFGRAQLLAAVEACLAEARRSREP